ncbi:MAG: calcium/sodium antiporter [Candidatus Amulumruptor caecigallinarius]|nr:calcium/sodium antiporter [Candidatus Amulumruptor caecigallinarius]
MFVGGLAMILAGANFMTDGSAALARRFGMSDFIVGLTIVSMMTSAPELVVSITSALNASTDMAIGNVVGSNIFNILMIVGICACIKPIKVTDTLLANEIPLVILSSVALLAIGMSPLLDGTAGAQISRTDAILLFLFFIVFLRYTIASAKKTRANNPEETGRKKELPLWQQLIYIGGGLAALIFGGQWFVDGASQLARMFGMSDAMIGLTIIAAGTSLPELATSVAAAMKGFPGMCIGNVIGSNIFNIFFVLGITGMIKPLGFGSIGALDLLVLTGASVLFWLVGRFQGPRIISRSEGAMMVLLYVGYIATLCLML